MARTKATIRRLKQPTFVPAQVEELEIKTL